MPVPYVPWSSRTPTSSSWTSRVIPSVGGTWYDASISYDEVISYDGVSSSSWNTRTIISPTSWTPR